MTIMERIKGALYGFALGDALGLGTEFMTRDEIKAQYPDNLRSFDGYVRDSHRGQWKRGQWTNDTELVLDQIRSILRVGELDENEFARDFKDTVRRLSVDVHPVLNTIMSTPGWEENPVECSREKWRVMGFCPFNNEALHRGLVAGLTTTGKEVFDWARRMVLTTHSDSRCIATAAILAIMANRLLYTGEPASYDDLVSICYSVDGRAASYLDIAVNGTLEDLHLDDEDTLAAACKGMAAGLWPLFHCDNAADYIYTVMDQGGDADSNAAISGMFAGLRYGYDALPPQKEELAGKEKLDELAAELTEYIDGKR